MNTDLLIEILCEELPAIPFLKEESHILEKWQNVLKEYRLNSHFEFFYTPRRLVLVSQNFPFKQSDQQVEFWGPPLQIAYIDGDKSKGLSKAGESFLKKAKSAGMQESMMQVREKDGKEVLYFVQELQGQESKQLLGEMIFKWLESLHFGKSMRWGSVEESFIRPIRNIAILFGGQSIECDLFGIQSKNQTFLHRDFGFEAQSFRSIAEYFELLQEGGVILDAQKRRAKILDEIAKIEHQYQVRVAQDDELLDEVVAITECPRVLYGQFDEEFLKLPKEVIITSMRENQRYFALYRDDKLHNGFAVVINSMSQEAELIVQGNEKVLRARLSDAMFFYSNDLKKPLADYDLSRIAFVEGLGNLKDKIQREGKIAQYLLSQNIQTLGNVSEVALLEAVSISKSDLLSEMVGEFPELQGVMGEYYALNEAKMGFKNRDEQIALALKEQYQPNGEEDSIPSSFMGALLALSYRLDLLMALFSIGKLPSGSKDPYGLRRAGNAILRITEEHPISLHESDLKELSKLYKEFDSKKVWEFLLERLEGILKINASIVRSVVGGRERDLRKIMKKASALFHVLEEMDKEAMMSTFKRVANITKDMQGKPEEIQEGLLQAPQEVQLYAKLQSIRARAEESESFEEQIKILFSLKDSLQEFFEYVMVNVEDVAIRENRKRLIYAIYWEFLEIGDIREISI